MLPLFPASALGNGYHGRTQHPVGYGITNLIDIAYGVVGQIRPVDLLHGLMHVGVKFFSFRIYPGNAMALQNLLQFPLVHLDTLKKAGKVFVLPCRLIGNRIDGSLKIVAKGQDIAGKFTHRIFGHIGLLALGALAQIVHIGNQPEIAILEIGQLVFQCLARPRHRFIAFICQVLILIRPASGRPARLLRGLWRCFVRHCILFPVVAHKTHMLRDNEFRPPFLVWILMGLPQKSSEQTSHQASGIIHNGDNSPIVQPGWPDNTKNADQLLLFIMEGRNDNGRTGQ